MVEPKYDIEQAIQRIQERLSAALGAYKDGDLFGAEDCLQGVQLQIGMIMTTIARVRRHAIDSVIEESQREDDDGQAGRP